jgi:predicted dehydrogenase
MPVRLSAAVPAIMRRWIVAVRIGIVGLGEMGTEHMNRLQQIEGAKMVAFCDVNATLAAQVAQQRGGKAYTDFDTMLKKARLDALWVCLPPFVHQGQEIQAAELGIHLYVEKPVALDLETAQKTAAAIRKAGIINSVGYQIRHCKHVAQARRVLRGRRVDFVTGRYLGNLKGTTGWWPIMSKSGGQIVEQATHVVDLMRYLAGEVRDVFASYALREFTNTPGWDIPDYSVLAIDFASGALGSLHASAAHPGANWETGVKVTAEDLELECTFDSLRVTRGNETREIRSQDDAILLADQAFVRSVEKGRPSGIRSSYADAVKTLAVTLAANESAERGERVSC